tara:strand:+ start:6452 stop:7159 length:708 start_codon:yes stop_codon:yes gene_type:complete
MTTYSSKAIALKYIKYGESSIISKMLTLKKGLQSFIVKGVRQKKSKQKLVCFEPLKLCEISVNNHKDSSTLQYLKKIDLLESINYNYINPNVNLLSIFIAEVILKTTKENFADKYLFEFIWETKKYLLTKNLINDDFIFVFLIKLSSYLGFQPSKENISNPYFDLEKARFVKIKNINTLNSSLSNVFRCLIKNEPVTLGAEKKSEVLSCLIKYYNIHSHDLNSLMSQKIIKSVMF